LSAQEVIGKMNQLKQESLKTSLQP